MKKDAVVVHDLTVAYNMIPVLLDIDLSLPSGSINAIIGPNGAGKTTLLKSILGLLKPISGEVHFPDLGFEKMPRRTTKIAYVPQSGSIDWDFPATVLDIVLMGRYGHLGWFRRPSKQDRMIAMDALQKMEMSPYIDRQISELSGGQQQRVFLARALAQDAQLYFMDEPFKGVDARTQNAIISLLNEIKKKEGTVIVVHHDLTTVRDYFDWVTIIRKQVIANGPTDQAFTEDKIRHAFGEGIRL